MGDLGLRGAVVYRSLHGAVMRGTSLADGATGYEIGIVCRSVRGAVVCRSLDCEDVGLVPSSSAIAMAQ